MTKITLNDDTEIEELIIELISKNSNLFKTSFSNEWMSLKEGAAYAKVSHNTFAKFRLMGLKVSEVNGIKRVSRKAIDEFLENHSY